MDEMKIRVIESQEAGYMCRWTTISDNRQHDSSQENDYIYNLNKNSSLESYFMTDFALGSSSKRIKSIFFDSAWSKTYVSVVKIN
jgi:hypothetical protein